jgi:predicted metalloprotease with PDZ domain
VTAAAGEPVGYHVTVRPDRYELAVRMTVPAGAGGEPLRVGSPTWVPGDYSFAAYGRDVFEVTAADPVTGAPLPVHRDGWQGYRVPAGSGAVISYRAVCSSWDFSEACGVLGDRAGVLTGARYLAVAGYRGPCRVTYELPPGWAVHHPSGAEPVAPFTWLYPSYEILLDTPVSLGEFGLVTVDVRGTPFHHVFLDTAAGSSSPAVVSGFIDQVSAVCERYHRMFGSFPFTDYTFVYAFNPRADWGLEHLTSTMIGLGPDVFADPDQHALGVRACAHEFFHAWNVRRLRPAPLGDLDLIGGSFTEGLWLAEGFTRYYEFLTCTRTGVYTAGQFLSCVVNYYRHLAVLPAYHRVSAVDSSLASYLNHDDKYPGRVNDCIDYYDKGMVIAFGLDATLRLEIPGGGLDESFAAFYQRYAGHGAGYTMAQVRDHFDEVRPGLGTRLLREVTEVAGLTLAEQLGRLGFLVEDETVRYLGLVLTAGTGPGIYGVLDTSPAGRSGIAAEDVLTAVDGLAFDLRSLTWAIAHQDVVTLTVRRGNAVRGHVVPVGDRSQIGRLSWAGSAGQAARIAAWLEQDFQPQPGEPLPLDFYENFHGVETVI